MYKLHLEGEGQDGRTELAYKIPHNDSDNIIYRVCDRRIISGTREIMKKQQHAQHDDDDRLRRRRLSHNNIMYKIVVMYTCRALALAAAAAFGSVYIFILFRLFI
jgi:hypothetical protein